MTEGLGNADVIKRIGELAFGRANDAVKLIFLDPERPELLDGLDLSMVSEVKRGSTGAVEVKLLNRVTLLELLSKLMEPSMSAENQAESFFNAMDKAAAKLEEGEV